MIKILNDDGIDSLVAASYNVALLSFHLVSFAAFDCVSLWGVYHLDNGWDADDDAYDINILEGAMVWYISGNTLYMA